MTNDIYKLDNDSAVEELIESLELPEIRITPAHIEKTVKEVKYHLFEGTNTTVCCLVLQNGFTLIGQSACVSDGNFDEKLGRTLAYQDAKRQIGRFEGYLLLQSIKQGEVTTDGTDGPDDTTEQTSDERLDDNGGDDSVADDK